MRASRALAGSSAAVSPERITLQDYQFTKFVMQPGCLTYTLTHIIFGFYTHYFSESFSFSILGGPEQYTTWGRRNSESVSVDSSSAGKLLGGRMLTRTLPALTLTSYLGRAD